MPSNEIREIVRGAEQLGDETGERGGVGSNMASVNVLSKAAKTQLSNYRLAVIDVFDTHYDILNSLLKTSIDTFASKAFQARLISEPVWEEKSYSSIVHEFKTGLKLCKSISEVQTQCCSFVDILVDLNGPARTFGKDLCEELQKLFGMCALCIIVTFDVYIYPIGNLEIIPNGLNEVKTGTLTTKLHA